MQQVLSKYSIKRLALSSILLGISAFSAPQALAITPQEVYNPKPAKDDIIVSMPCDAFMVFKKVYTSSAQDNKLNDKSFKAGSNDTQSPLSQSLNTRYVQGAFHDKDGYYYLMAKYELNSAQYEILKSYDGGKGKCPTKGLSIKSKMAMSNISWFDAMEVAHQFSLYLANKNTKDKILGPDKKTIAYARLPIDSEWEFAARGGTVVSSSEFSADLFPFAKDKNLADYVWYKGQDSAADGKVRVIGLKEPNPLGLYDILGNVSEMMFDPFHAVRTGRLHGQTGGFIVRGGSVLSSKDEITTSYRGERAYYSRNGVNKGRDMGARFVLSLPFTTDFKEVRELNEQLANLGVDNDAEDIKGGGNLNTIAQLDKLLAEQKANTQKIVDESKKANDTANQYKQENELLQKQITGLSQGLSKLRQDMIEANTRRDEMRNRAIISNLRLGGYLCSQLAAQKIVVDQNLKNEEIVRRLPILACRKDAESKECKLAKEQQEAKLKHNRELANHTLDFFVSYYADHIVDTVDTFDYKFIAQQEENAKIALGQANKSSLSDYIGQFVKDLKSFESSGRNLKENQERWIKQCSAYKVN